jgi:integrase
MRQNAARTPATLADLVPLYIAHARVYYRHADGTPTREHLNLASTLSSLLRYAGGRVRLVDLDRVTVRGWMNDLVADDLSRVYINKSLARVRRFARWAVEEYSLPAAVLAELSCVRSLPPHRSAARETDPVRPAELDQVRAALAFLPGAVGDVCRVLMLTGARLSEVLLAENRDVLEDQAGAYRLVCRQHKTAHLGKPREIPLNPDAMVVLGRWQRPLCPRDPIFPRAGRGRRRSIAPNVVRASIRRACERAGVEVWTPHQLRHAVATVIRDRRGLDASSALLGHSHVNMTEHYARLSFSRAQEAAQALRLSDIEPLPKSATA